MPTQRARRPHFGTGTRGNKYINTQYSQDDGGGVLCMRLFATRVSVGPSQKNCRRYTHAHIYIHIQSVYTYNIHTARPHVPETCSD